MEAALYALLTQNSGVASLATAGVFWIARDQNAGFPSVVLTKISGPRSYTHQGADGLSTARVQCDCDALSRTSALALRDEVKACISGYHDATLLAVFIENERQQSDNTKTTQQIYRVSFDLMITHKE